MITLRPRATLHATDGGWFHARVFNDDTLVPGDGLADAPAPRHRGHHVRRRGDDTDR